MIHLRKYLLSLSGVSVLEVQEGLKYVPCKDIHANSGKLLILQEEYYKKPFNSVMII